MDTLTAPARRGEEALHCKIKLDDLPSGSMSSHGGARPRAGRKRKFRASRNLVIRVEERLHERLTTLAEEKDTTVSEMVRPLLERLAKVAKP
jgi:macrodomain Ter protein organizer (MatP/YcbG family)